MQREQYSEEGQIVRQKMNLDIAEYARNNNRT